MTAAAAAQTIDYPSSSLASPPQLTFPFYTPGGGSTGQTVRYQALCTDGFLSTQNLTAGLVTKIGFSLAGQATYSTLELRAGATAATFLGSDWAVNLPDQRVQKDLSNTLLLGGGTPSAPVNQWVEYELDYPFYWQPGQGIVIDLIATIAVAGSYVSTTSGAPMVPRALNFNYTSGALANSFSSAGIAFRMVFASTDIVTFGDGCIGQSGVAPTLSSVGAASLGGTMVVSADQVLAPTVGGFLLGFSRTSSGAVALPAALGGGCSLLVAPDVFALAAISPIGGGLGTAAIPIAVPQDPLLTGTVLYTQWAQFDGGSPAIAPVTFSSGGAIVVF
jgi:hypothetical protein